MAANFAYCFRVVIMLWSSSMAAHYAFCFLSMCISVLFGVALGNLVRFCFSKTGLSPHPRPSPRSPVVFQLTIQRRSLICSSSLIVRQWFRMWRFCWSDSFVIRMSFGDLGGLWFVIVSFTLYRHKYFFNRSEQISITLLIYSISYQKIRFRHTLGRNIFKQTIIIGWKEWQ